MDARYAHRRQAALRHKRACDANTSHLNLMHPLFNLREVAKQMLLLEDHLQHPWKHCPDCIRKHLMTIEAFCEEAVSLDKIGTYRDAAEEMAGNAREWLEGFEDGRPLPEIAQEIRKVRKILIEIVSLVAGQRGSRDRVAARFIAANTPCPHRRIPLHG
jgi:hypothetical protein